MVEAARSGERVGAHRQRLRQQGLRPIQIWVPDVRAPGFKAEAERQARRIASDARDDEVMDFIEAAADPDDN